jgi:DnaJ-domain-containing protein 1
MKRTFTSDIAESTTSEEVQAVIDQVLADVEEFKSDLDTEIRETISLARNNPNLEDSVEEAQNAGDHIREIVDAEFASAYAEGEVQAAAKNTTLVFAEYLEGYPSQFEDRMTKDAVDEREADLKSTLDIVFNAKVTELNRIAKTHGL